MECRLINKKQVPRGAVKRATSETAVGWAPGLWRPLTSLPAAAPRAAGSPLCPRADPRARPRAGCAPPTTGPQSLGVLSARASVSLRRAMPAPSRPQSVSLPSRNRSEGCLEAWNFPGSVDSTAKGGLCVPESRRRWFVKVDLRTGACPSLPAGMTDGRFPAVPQPGRGRKQHPSRCSFCLRGGRGD